VTLPHVFAEDELDPREPASGGFIDSKTARRITAPYGTNPADLTTPVVDVPLPPEPAATVPQAMPADEPTEPATDAREVAKWQMRALQGGFRTAGIPDRDERLAVTSEWIGREIGSASDLTFSEAGLVLERLAEINTPADADDTGEPA